MRRTITLLCAFTIVSTVATTAAQAATARRYDGTTSQDRRLVFILRKADDGALNLKVVDVKRFVLTCEDYTTQIWGVTWFWGGRGLPLDGRDLNLYENDGQSAFAIQGHFGAEHATGTLIRFTVASLTDDEQAQACTTGDLTWDAERVSRAPQVEARMAATGVVRHFPGHLTVAMRRLS
jgi:hypothetical protein